MSDRSHVLRDVVIGVLVLVVGTAILAFANMPTRVSLVEQTAGSLEKKLDRMDGKIDTLLSRRNR